MNVTRLLVFLALAATAYPAHMLADHVLGQTDRQVDGKAGRGRAGWGALARHVGAYHLVVAAMCAVTVVVFHVPLGALGAAVGLAISAGTHALWDRRAPVRWVLVHTGAAKFANLADFGMNGMYLSDQSLHLACLWLACLVAAVV